VTGLDLNIHNIIDLNMFFRKGSFRFGLVPRNCKPSDLDQSTRILLWYFSYSIHFQT